MNLFEKFEELKKKELIIIDNVLKEYFTGHTVIMRAPYIEFEDPSMTIDCQIVIEEEPYEICVIIDYWAATHVSVETPHKIFDRTVTGYLEQTIKRELADKSLILSEE